jgi:hypothetical protein
MIDLRKVLAILLFLGEEFPTEIQRVLDTLQLVSNSLAAIAWIAVGIGWFTGWIKLALPIPSRSLRRSAQSDVETAGFAAFCIAIFSTLISIILWIIRSAGGVIVPPP